MLVDIHFDTPSDTILHDTHWAKWVILGGDLVVPDGVTLKVDSGAVISFVPKSDYEASGVDTGRVELIVDGDLNAEGGASDSIIFRPAGKGRGYTPEANDWHGIRLRNEGGDTLKYCELGHGYLGISLRGQFAAAGSTLINNCWVHDNLYAGIECFRSHAVIESTTIEKTEQVGESSIGLYLYHCSARTFHDTIRNNLPYNVYWIGSHPDSGWKARIEDCVIRGEGKTSEDDAYGIVLSKGFADGSIISNTSVNKNSQAGVSLLYNWGLVDVDECTIKKNYQGILANRKVTQLAGTSYVEISRSTIKNNTTGVKVSNVPRAYVNLGDITAGTGGSNNITLNATHAVNAGTTTQMAEDNWWGSDPPPASMIVGPWDYNPWKTGPVQLGPRLPGQEVAATYRAYPNPSSGIVAVELTLRRPTRVKLAVYDVAGRLVSTPFEGKVDHGGGRLVWDGTDDLGRSVNPGIYFCRVEAGGKAQTIKVVLLK